MCSNKSGVDYVVVKINGVDINQMPKCEAVQTFLQTKGPIVVELCRRTSSDCDVGRGSIDVEKLRITTDDSKLNKSKSVSASPNLKNKTTTTHEVNTLQISQTNAAATQDNELILTLQTNGICSMVNTKVNNEVSTQQQQTKATNLVFLTSQQTQTDEQTCVVVNAENAQQHEMARKLADRFIEQEHHLFEQCLEPEIDIEEVTLMKNGAGDCKEHFGLTVCYSGSTVGSSSAGGSSVAGNNNNNNGGGVASVQNIAAADDNESACTEVFISDIQLNSVAERDGRLRRGDQILQINGNDIKSREDTELLLAESCSSLTLLVSRYLYAEDEASEDDDDDEEYYVDNNLAYANGFIVNDYTNVVDKLDRALTLEKQMAATNKILPTNKVEQVDCLITPTDAKADGAIDNKTSSAQSIKKAQHNAKSTTTTTKTNEMKIMLQDVKEKSGDVIRSCDVNNTLVPLSNCSARKYEYDDTEHIYETIPEDSESEPFYCSPYQSSTYMTAVGSCSSATDALELQQQKQRVAQWLGIKSNAVSMHTIAATTPAVRLSLYGGGNRTATSMSQRTTNKICTMRSAVTNTTSGSSSSGGGAGCPQAIGDSIINPIDELENSSSAYNTGGSNNSASPLALALNKNHQQTITGGQVDIESAGAAKNRVGNQTILNKTQRLQSPKEQTTTSPKNIIIAPFGKSFVADNVVRNKTSVDDAQTFSKTLYRNETNSYQAVMLQQQQQYFRNTAGHQHRQLEQPTSSQFNAPNLSQYHFVSSQEVATSTMNVNTASPKLTLPTEVTNKIVDDEATPMVWKVKRRPDGTRYIVRRPAARNRLPCVRRTIRNNDITTTEDDTISEVKIGRYWTKEERKRHIERARERRQQQQQQQLP